MNTDGHGWCFVRVDLGQVRDPSAVAERVVKITRSEAMAGRCTLVVDATGAGRPVVDLLKRERPGWLLMPVNITGGTWDAVL